MYGDIIGETLLYGDIIGETLLYGDIIGETILYRDVKRWLGAGGGPRSPAVAEARDWNTS